MHAPAEPEPGLAVELEQRRRTADVDEVPGRRLQQHVGRGGADFALFAAHDAAQTQRPGRIGDQNGGFRQFALHAIQRSNCFALIWQAGDDVDGTVGAVVLVGAAAQEVVVEGVVGFAHFQHDVVANVDNHVDGPLPGQLQAALHPAWAGLLADAGDDHGGETRVQVGMVGADLHLAGYRWAFHDHIVAGITHGLAGQGGYFAGHADDGGAAGDVGDDVDADNGVAKHILQGRAGRIIAGQDHDAFVVVAEAEFFFGTQHAAIVDAA